MNNLSEISRLRAEKFMQLRNNKLWHTVYTEASTGETLYLEEIFQEVFEHFGAAIVAANSYTAIVYIGKFPLQFNGHAGVNIMPQEQVNVAAASGCEYLIQKHGKLLGWKDKSLFKEIGT